MKTIKLALVAVAMLVAVSAESFAQGGGGGGGGGRGQGRGGGRGVAALLNGVSDSAAVTEKATAIFTAAQTAMMEARAGVARGTPPDSATMAKTTAITTKRNDDIKALLTKDADKKKFDENVAAQAAGRRGGGR
jgi:hypothetical protein